MDVRTKIMLFAITIGILTLICYMRFGCAYRRRLKKEDPAAPSDKLTLTESISRMGSRKQRSPE